MLKEMIWDHLTKQWCEATQDAASNEQTDSLEIVDAKGAMAEQYLNRRLYLNVHTRRSPVGSIEDAKPKGFRIILNNSGGQPQDRAET
jgi:hypothetical protein